RGRGARGGARHRFPRPGARRRIGHAAAGRPHPRQPDPTGHEMDRAMSAREGIGMTSERTRLRMIEQLRAGKIVNESVLRAMTEVPRHLFVDEGIASRAYEFNTALPIGHGQTISAPIVVALMTQLLLEKSPMDKVLEIGTGCGYQTAVLAKLVKE